MTEQLSPTGRFDRVLLATDGSDFSAGAVRAGIELAQRCGTNLNVLTMVLTNPEYAAIAPQLEERAELEALQVIEGVKTQADALGVTCEGRIRHGEDPAREIIEEAESGHYDLIIMGRRGKRRLARWMVGHATVQVIGGAACPVLVVPRAASLPNRRILLATDGSRYGDAAAAAAASLSSHCRLPVCVISVIKPGHSEARRAEATQVVERISRLLAREGIEVEGRVGEGRPEEVIADTAKSVGADLIIMGSHGRTGFERILLGSVSERVIGLADCATLVVSR